MLLLVGHRSSRPIQSYPIHTHSSTRGTIPHPSCSFCR